MESDIWYFGLFCLKKRVNPKENKGKPSRSKTNENLSNPLFSLGFTSFFKKNRQKYKIFDSIYAGQDSGAKVRLTFQEFEEKSKFHQNAQMFELFH